MTEAIATKQRAKRGAEERVTAAFVIPVRLKRTITSIARLTDRSESMVVSAILDEAIGSAQPSRKAS